MTRVCIPSRSIRAGLGAWLGAGIAAACLGGGAAAAADGYAAVRPLLKKYCFDCHTGDEGEAGFALDRFKESTAKTTDRASWQKVLRQIQGRAMPPKDSDQPSDAERQAINAWIEGYALKPDCSRGERPGHVTLRRLNRAEYNNTVRDLFGVSITPADDFPSDDVGYGFDNIGDVLSLPPVLFERYVNAAMEVSRAAVVTADADSAPVRSFDGKQFPSNGEVKHEMEFSAKGDYILRIRAAGDQAGKEPAKMGILLDDKEVKKIDVRNRRDKPRDFEHRLEVPAGKHSIAVSFLNDFYDKDSEDKSNRDRNLVVERITVVGPIGVLPDPLPESHRRLFKKPIDPAADRSEQMEQAKDLLRPVVSRAFRRKATDDELDALVTVFIRARDRKESVERGMQDAVAVMLTAPSFLFRVEQDPPPGKVRTLDDFETASRLSYFLWSSMPDDQLFRAASRGELRTDEQVAAQAARMLADPKARALVENFAGQWLQLRSLEESAPDVERFPAFDDGLRAAMRRETEEFFWTIVREDRSVLEFLDADWTIVNERLAKHYGLEGVHGEAFVRVGVDRGRRGGLLGQASVLTVTSNPTRTSPVKRGKWILENLFAAPPPPPPPGVPELAEAGAKLEGTLRERMEQHRSNPACAACHQLMDPLGFGLENYDAVGGWRTADGKAAVDAGGELPDGRKFNGPGELRGVLLGRKDEFRRCLAEKLLTYALGRGLEWYDACAVERIAANCAAGGDRFSVLVREIVVSPAFRKREAAGGR